MATEATLPAEWDVHVETDLTGTRVVLTDPLRVAVDQTSVPQAPSMTMPVEAAPREVNLLLPRSQVAADFERLVRAARAAAAQDKATAGELRGEVLHEEADRRRRLARADAGINAGGFDDGLEGVCFHG